MFGTLSPSSDARWSSPWDGFQACIIPACGRKSFEKFQVFVGNRHPFEKEQCFPHTSLDS